MRTRSLITVLFTLGSAATVRAQAQADVIVAVDGSGSMDQEIAMVQAELNGFAAAVQAAGVDLHVILISKAALCPPAPLGSGSCPSGENLPIFRHVIANIASNDLLATIVATYGSWSSSLRPSASTTLIAISDDDDNSSAAQFSIQFQALNPSFQDYRLHALACQSLCPSIAAAVGTQYLALATQTGGQSFDLCDQDFGPDFAAMAVAIVAASSSYCTSATTSHGCLPAISGVGGASASASSGYTITVNGVEGQRSGLIFYGLNNAGWTPSPWGGGSTSYLCVKAPTQRTPAHNSGGTASQCDGVLAIDWNAFVAGNPSALGAPFAGGESVYAQGWFRDPPAPKTTNLSNALAFVVEP